MRPIDADALKNAPIINPYEWISVEDRLPEKNQDVLVYSGNFIGGMMNVYTYVGNDNWADDYGHWGNTELEGITHWMSLPTPPTTKHCEKNLPKDYNRNRMGGGKQ